MRIILSIALFLTASAVFAQNTYYSRVNGNWSAPATWSTVSCSGAAAASTPGTNDNVVICAGRTVTFNAAAATTIANLTIELTGVFDIDVNRNLSVNSLVLNGTVTGSAGGDLRVGNVAGSTLSGSGIFSTSVDISNLRLVNNVTVLAGSDIKFEDEGRLNFSGRTLINNGKISFFAPSTFFGAGVFINNASTSYLFFARAGNWPGNTVLTATATGNTVEYGAAGGSRSLDRQSSYYHLLISGGGTKKFRGTNTIIRGNLTISNGSTLDMNTGTRTLSIAGNWINNLGGTFNENTSLVTFNGSANNQALAPPAAGETFYDLAINNTLAGGSVTSSGNVSITSGRTLTMTSGIFDMGTNTLGQTGAANLTATGGDLRLAKLSATLPEFTGTYNITGGTITFNGSAAQTIRTLNAVPANYHNIVLSSGGTKTLGGDITVRGNWTNTGTTLAGNFTVNFAGSGIQTITNTAGEVFYGLTANTTGPLTLQASTNVTVANTLTMTSGNINLNNRILTLGNASGATLARTAGICYGGTFRRYVPLGAISSTVAPRYGLFPVGTPIYYRPVEINSTANPTTAGYVSVVHTDATTATDVSYNDVDGDAIQRVSDMRSTISTATLAGGTYTLSVSMTTLSSAGLLTDLKMETIAGPPYGPVPSAVPTTGTVANPTVIRSGLSVTHLNNIFVVGTKNKSTTPMVSTYFSRRTGNWNDATIGNSTWSLTDGGVSCNCVPTTSAIVYINPSHTVSIVTTPATTDFITVRNSATLAGTANLTLNYNLTTEGTGKIAPTAGSWAITRDLIIAGTSASTSGATLTITGNLEVDAANSLTAGNSIQITGNIIVDGTLAMGANSLALLGTGTTISGSLGGASITGSNTITITNAKTILSSSTLNIQPVMSLSANTTVTNLGTVTHTGNLTGANAATSVWTNGSNGIFNTTGAVLATGTLNASASPNTINYNGGGAQTVKSPASSYYTLIISNAGIKTLGGSVTVTNNLTIQDAAILNAGTNILNGAASVIMDGTSELRIGRAADGIYPELTGSYSLNSGTVTFNPGSNAYDIREIEYFNLTLSGSGASTYDFNNSVTVNNDLLVNLSGTARIRNMDAPVVVTNDFLFNSTSSNASSIADDLTVGTFTLTAGLITPGNVTIEITEAGGWNRNGGTFTPGGNTKVLFSGTVDQQIGGSVATTFTDFELANSGATGVVLNQDVTISDVLTFTEGNLVTSASNILTMAAGSSVTTVSDDSFVDGPMLKTGNSNFIFPVGKDGIYRPIEISTLSASGTFHAEYFHSDPSAASYDVNLHDVTLTRVNSGEYWILNRTSGTPNAFVTLSWDSYSGTVDELSSLRVAKWNGSTWNDLGNGAVSGSVSPGTGTIRTAAIVSVFSPFTLAASNGNNPLPIVLLDFQAKLINDEVEINWTTASEYNNNYFTLEKTRNAKKFETVTIVPGAGTTQLMKHYNYIDDKPYAGIFYYRLKQTDFDGKSSYSHLIAIDNRGGIENPTVNVFPNPTDGIPVQVSLRGLPGVENVTFELWDVAGKKVKSQQATTDENGQVLRDFDTNFLPPGFYILKASYSSGTQKVKLIVN